MIRDHKQNHFGVPLLILAGWVAVCAAASVAATLHFEHLHHGWLHKDMQVVQAELANTALRLKELSRRLSAVDTAITNYDHATREPDAE